MGIYRMSRGVFLEGLVTGEDLPNIIPLDQRALERGMGLEERVNILWGYKPLVLV